MFPGLSWSIPQQLQQTVDIWRLGNILSYSKSMITFISSVLRHITFSVLSISKAKAWRISVIISDICTFGASFAPTMGLNGGPVPSLKPILWSLYVLRRINLKKISWKILLTLFLSREILKNKIIPKKFQIFNLFHIEPAPWIFLYFVRLKHISPKCLSPFDDIEKEFAVALWFAERNPPTPPP